MFSKSLRDSLANGSIIQAIMKIVDEMGGKK